MTRGASEDAYDRPEIGVDFLNPRPGEKHPNSHLDLMGDPNYKLSVLFSWKRVIQFTEPI